MVGARASKHTAQKRSRDVDALAFDPEDSRDPRSKHFIPREGSRKRGLEITFDPSSHKCAAGCDAYNRWQVDYLQIRCIGHDSTFWARSLDCMLVPLLTDNCVRRDWVTGFRKRKNERKTAGLKYVSLACSTLRAHALLCYLST